MLERAWADAARGLREVGADPAPFQVCVNVSLASANARRRTSARASPKPCPSRLTSTEPAQLVLEMTENGVPPGRRTHAGGPHRAQGESASGLALDGFGTGYSCLGYLDRLPVDIIKIDQTFVAKLGADPGPQSVVTLIVELAHGLGMSVVAEGVETAEQHQVLN